MTIPAVKDIAVPFPPLAEQKIIAIYIQGTLARTDAIASKTQRSLDHLREYRQALITAAVTGQLDIEVAT